MKNQAFFNNPEISSKCLICAAPSLSHGIRARDLARTSRGIANAQNHLEGHHMRAYDGPRALGNHQEPFGTP